MACCHVALTALLSSPSAASFNSLASIAPTSSKDIFLGVTHREQRFEKKTKIYARCQADAPAPESCQLAVGRRAAVTAVIASVVGVSMVQKSMAAGLPPKDETNIKICNEACEKSLAEIPEVTTASGLVYKDIVVGGGPSPPVGFQVAANYVAMVPGGKIFDSSLERGIPYIFRVGSGQVIPGLDEGILSMKVGGIRRLYIPGPLAFPKGLPAAAGRPRVPPSTPVVFDVNLVYIPGLEDEEE